MDFMSSSYLERPQRPGAHGHARHHAVDVVGVIRRAGAVRSATEGLDERLAFLDIELIGA
jgi:hypothetical protein